MKASEVLKFSRPLWGHQAQAIDRFSHQNEMALLHEMGTGKTTTAIGWCRTKYGLHKEILNTLVISPVATLYNWKEEFERNSPEHVYSKAVVVTGSAKKRAQLIRDTDAKIFITNPEVFDMKEVVDAIREKGIKILILDEAHKFKNFKSKRLGSLLSVSDFCQYRAIMTGTPILNSYLDIWALWRILDSGRTFGLNYFVFREAYFYDANLAWKGKPKYFPRYLPKPGSALELAEKLNEKASRMTKAECLTLPPVVRKTEYVEMSIDQASAYRQMEQDLVAEVREGACVAVNALSRVLRMLQILSGYVQLTEGVPIRVQLKDNPRLTRLYELLEEITPQAKVIVWSHFQENYEMIKGVCKELDLEWAELTGGTKDRQANIERFRNDPTCRVMISNPQAGGVGVNLVEASYAIYYSRSFSLGDRLQSEARNHRGGSEMHDKITLIDLVVKDTLDLEVLRALERKENFADNVLDRLKSR